VWLLARRSASDPKELAYYFALAPKTVSLQQLATVAGTRYTVEQVIKEARSEVGFDRYVVRYWHSWYRHITLSMLAQVWLADQQHVAGEKKRAWRISPCPKCGAYSKWPCPCLCGASASGWPGRIGGGANATGRASATTVIGIGPSTPDPIRSIPPDLSTIVILVQTEGAERIRRTLPKAPAGARQQVISANGTFVPLRYEQ
jgi:hypothetical protein